MITPTAIDNSRQQELLQWAAEHQAALTVSMLPESHWHGMRSQMVRLDLENDLLQIIYPICGDHQAPPEIAAGQELGISFRRGHKKCIFVTPVVMRRIDTTPSGQPVDTLVLRAPTGIREMQRRLYQRVGVPAHQMYAVKLWQGGPPKAGQANWPLCAGRVGNISLGGMLIEIRADQNPRLSAGERVGIEVTVQPNLPPIIVDAQYRHCVLINPERLGLGLQFVGLEQDAPGKATLTRIAEFVKEVRRAGIAVGPDSDD